ncbi:MAG: FUSC family protein [bacterium]|nr:FUSC family protein [bacterium]
MKNQYDKRTLKLQRQEAFCIATAMSIAAIIAFCYKTQQAYWLITTAGLLFSVPARGMIIRRSKHRIIGTFLGLIISFFFIKTFMYTDYRWCYLLPLIYLAVNYLLVVTSIYAVAVFAICLLVPIIQVVFGAPSFSLDTILIKRFEFTLIAVLIALSCEYIIYKNAAISSRKYKLNIYSHFIDLGNTIDTCSSCFTGKKRMPKELIIKLNSSRKTKASIDAMYTYLKIEFEYEINRKEFMNFTLNHFCKIDECIRKIICINNHESFNDTKIPELDFKIFSRFITYKYKFLIKYVNGRQFNQPPNIHKLIKKINESNQSSPTQFFLEELVKLDKYIDEYISKFQPASPRIT